MTSIEFHRRIRQTRNAEVADYGGRLRRIVSGLQERYRAWQRKRLNRAAFRNLLEQDDWVFEDIGISRADAEWAAGLPMHVNSAQEMEKLRARGVLGA